MIDIDEELTQEDYDDFYKKNNIILEKLEKDKIKTDQLLEKDKTRVNLNTFNQVYRMVSNFKKDKISREKAVEQLDEYVPQVELADNMLELLYGVEEQEKIQKFNLIDFEKEFPEPPCYINGIIFEAGTTLIASDPGTGKTWVLLGMAGHLISGKTFYTHSVPKKVKVAYIDEENSIHTMGRRISKLMKEGLFIEDDKDCFRYYLQPNIKMNHGESGFKTILEDLREFSPDVIFIDAFTRVFEGDENSSEQTKGVFEGVKLLRKLLDKPNLAIVFAHHTRKDSSKSSYSIRGSSDIMAQPEATFILEKYENNDNILSFYEYKSRNEKIPPMLIKLIDSEDKTGLRLDFEDAPNEEVKKEKKETEGMKENTDRIFKYLKSHNNKITSAEAKSICTSQRYGNIALTHLLNNGDLRMCAKKQGRTVIYEANEQSKIFIQEEDLYA